jgi:primosomal protein N' (replication factor Y)
MEQQKNYFVIDVIPLTRISAARQPFFSYTHSSPISSGTLVSVPFFRRSIEGVVIGSRDSWQHSGNFKLKAINKIIQESFVSEKQLELAKFISDYYLLPLGLTLKAFTPKPTKERARTAIIKNPQLKEITLTSEQEHAVANITSAESKKFLLFGPSSSGKTEVYIHAILELLKQDTDAQFLILIPELTLSDQAIERYGAHFSDQQQLAILHSKLTKGEFFTNWQKIQNGQARVIIGTRMAVFAPFKNLSLIVIDEEQDPSYKQWDGSLRYDARTVCEKLSQIHGASLVIGTATPRIESFFKTQDGIYTLLKLPNLSINGKTVKNATAEIVDMRKERWTDFKGKTKPNYSCISRQLQNEITYALTNRLQSVLFINHQGMNSFTVCANSDCKEVLRCPNCQRTLIYGNDGEYSCLHCSHKSGAFPTCKKCHGTAFRNIGLGTQVVQREIKKLFPQARVLRYDAAEAKTAGGYQKVYEAFKNNQFDILIGTQMITKGWDLPKVALIGIIDADALFTIPDFFTDERAFQNIVQASGRTARIGSTFPGRIIIQCYDPLNQVIQLAAEKNFEAFYDKQIEQREALSLPPFGLIVKLIYSDSNKSKVDKETEKAFELLSASGFDSNVRISEPHEPLVSKVRSKFKKQLIIKVRGKNAELPDNLKNIIKKFGNGWIIDVNPISIV